MDDGPTVPSALTVTQRRQLEIYLAAAQASISATDRALAEFESKLSELQDLRAQFHKVGAEWSAARHDIFRCEAEARAARDAALDSHKATLDAGALIVELQQKVLRLEDESKRHTDALGGHSKTIQDSIHQATTQLAFRSLVGFLLAVVAMVGVVVAAVQLGTVLPRAAQAGPAAVQPAIDNPSAAGQPVPPE